MKEKLNQCKIRAQTEKNKKEKGKGKKTEEMESQKTVQHGLSKNRSKCVSNYVEYKQMQFFS